MKCTISGIIKNHQGECLSENGWNKDVHRAVLFTPQQIGATIKLLSDKTIMKDVVAVYVIQNEKFDYHGTKEKWVYLISEAQVKVLTC